MPRFSSTTTRVLLKSPTLEVLQSEEMTDQAPASSAVRFFLSPPFPFVCVCVCVCVCVSTSF